VPEEQEPAASIEANQDDDILGESLPITEDNVEVDEVTIHDFVQHIMEYAGITDEDMYLLLEYEMYMTSNVAS
jgi:hypothetical protein